MHVFLQECNAALHKYVTINVIGIQTKKNREYPIRLF